MRRLISLLSFDLQKDDRERALQDAIGPVSNLLMKIGATEWLRLEASVRVRHE